MRRVKNTIISPSKQQGQQAKDRCDSIQKLQIHKSNIAKPLQNRQKIIQTPTKVFTFGFSPMLRRVIWLLLLVAVAYAVYRMIDPQGAQDLVQQMQSYFSKDTEIVQNLPDEVPDETKQEQDMQPSVDSYAIYTGSIDRESLVELDYILDTQGTGSSDDEPTVESPEEPQTTTPTPAASTPTTTPASTSTPTPTSTSSSPKPKSLSNQDKADLKTFLNAIVE